LLAGFAGERKVLVLLDIVRSQLRRRIVTGNGLRFANGFLFPPEVEKQLQDYAAKIFRVSCDWNATPPVSDYSPAHRPPAAPIVLTIQQHAIMSWASRFNSLF